MRFENDPLKDEICFLNLLTNLLVERLVLGHAGAHAGRPGTSCSQKQKGYNCTYHGTNVG